MAQTVGDGPHEPAPNDPRMEAADRDEVARMRAMTPGERLAEAIELSRVATRLAAPDPRPRDREYLDRLAQLGIARRKQPGG